MSEIAQNVCIFVLQKVDICKIYIFNELNTIKLIQNVKLSDYNLIVILLFVLWGQVFVRCERVVSLSHENYFSYFDGAIEKMTRYIYLYLASERRLMNDDDARSKMHSGRLALGTQQFSDINRQADVTNSIYVAPLDNLLGKTY